MVCRYVCTIFLVILFQTVAAQLRWQCGRIIIAPSKSELHQCRIQHYRQQQMARGRIRKRIDRDKGGNAPEDWEEINAGDHEADHEDIKYKREAKFLE